MVLVSKSASQETVKTMWKDEATLRIKSIDDLHVKFAIFSVVQCL